MIYFVQDTSTLHIKIGCSGPETVDFFPSWSLVKDRMAALQTGNPSPLAPLALVNGGLELERRLHAEFAKDRVNGEWFRPSFEILHTMMELRGQFLMKLARQSAFDAGRLEERRASAECFENLADDSAEYELCSQHLEELQRLARTLSFDAASTPLDPPVRTAYDRRRHVLLSLITDSLVAAFDARGEPAAPDEAEAVATSG